LRHFVELQPPHETAALVRLLEQLVDLLLQIFLDFFLGLAVLVLELRRPELEGIGSTELLLLVL
jgi:hypothetical protein